MSPLWIALYLPDLPLQAAGRGLLIELPFAVQDGPEERPVILAANRTARKISRRNIGICNN